MSEIEQDAFLESSPCLAIVAFLFPTSERKEEFYIAKIRKQRRNTAS
jgi:hypothetical protein